jgi:hypothetical protein
MIAPSWSNHVHKSFRGKAGKATAAAAPKRTPVKGTRFFLIMALVMASIIIAGFSLNLAMGRSSFGAPWPFCVHGMIFMGWLGL